MKKLYVCIGLFFIALTTFAQKDTAYYFDAGWKPCEIEEAEYFRIVKKDSLKPDHYNVFDFFATGEMQFQSTYRALSDSIDWSTIGHNDKRVLNGFAIYYYKNGHKKAKRLYVNGVLQSGARWWYDNGELSARGRYVNNKKTGEWIFYDVKGNISHIKNYYYGELHGICKQQNYYGELFQEGNYFNGIEIGPEDYWGEHGFGKVEGKVEAMSGDKNALDTLKPLLLLPKWKPGDRFVFKSSVQNKLIRNDSLIYEKETIVDNSLEVIDKSVWGYKLKYNYIEHRVNSRSTIQAFMDDPVSILIDSLKTKDIILQCDPMGNLRSVENWQELKKLFLDVVKSTVVKQLALKTGIYMDKEAVSDTMAMADLYTEEHFSGLLKLELGFIFSHVDKCIFPATESEVKIRLKYNKQKVKGNQLRYLHPVDESDQSIRIHRIQNYKGRLISEIFNTMYEPPEEVLQFIDREEEQKRVMLSTEEQIHLNIGDCIPNTYRVDIVFGNDEISYQTTTITKASRF